MKRCLDLAQKAIGNTYPNPMVGCVIVYNGKIIGEGYHHQAGLAHAEVNAIESVQDQDLLKKSTLYVSLEPCCHTGKTPPCSELIIRKKIPNVVIATRDPHSKVAGKGIKQLEATGIQVTVGVLETEARELNKRFFCFHQHKRPYIILKWAETADRFIAPKERNNQSPVWISGQSARKRVHQWRTEEQSILVGTQTVIDDNPLLTARGVGGNQPLRVVIDRSLRIGDKANVYNEDAKTLIVTEKKPGKSYKSIPFAIVNFKKPLAKQICELLYKQNVQSVIVEGGSKTLQTFIDENLWDEARIFRGQSTFGEGTYAPKLNASLVKEEGIESDQLFIFKNLNSY